MISKFLFSSFAVLSGIFTLGALSMLYLQYRTRMVRFMLFFILSLLLISFGFWGFEFILISENNSENISVFFIFIQSIGSVLNIIIIPYFTESLVNLSVNRKSAIAIWLWNILFITGTVIFFIFPGKSIYLPVLGIMQILTILFWISVIIYQIGRIKDRDLRRSLFFFILISSVFVVFLILDMMITTLPIDSLSFLDNFSLPLYFAAINGGSFFFAGRFLNRRPLVDEQKITEHFRKTFEISPRESDLVNQLLMGKTNKEIGNELCISVKTVENHLYNIYRKTDVTGRGQLMHLLYTWQKG